ncbi:hypothetical protein D3C87_1736210 [compost metagenome]
MAREIAWQRDEERYPEDGVIERIGKAAEDQFPGDQLPPVGCKCVEPAAEYPFLGVFSI